MSQELHEGQVKMIGWPVEQLIQDALGELGLDSPDQAEIEVVDEGSAGFLGMGRQPATVLVTKKRKRRRRRNRNRNRNKDGGRERQEGGTAQAQDRGQNQGNRNRANQDRGNRNKGGTQSQNQGSGKNRNRNQNQSGSKKNGNKRVEDKKQKLAETASDVESFLEGLVAASGLDGSVSTEIDGDFITARVDGEGLETLIGPKGASLDAIRDLARTATIRASRSGPRLRLDIGGYQERRAEALKIYATRLAEEAISDQEEIMLEAMPAPDRKVVHHAVAEIEGVESFSEGEDPYRSVVIAPTGGGQADDEAEASDNESSEEE